MDLNLFYFQHQLSLMQAASASSRLLRTRHLAAAATLANRIQIYQASKGATAAPEWLRDNESSERAAQIPMGLSI